MASMDWRNDYSKTNLFVNLLFKTGFLIVNLFFIV